MQFMPRLAMLVAVTTGAVRLFAGSTTAELAEAAFSGDAAAAKGLERAAEGDPVARYCLAAWYAAGPRQSRDDKRAIHEFTALAGDGQVDALFALAWLQDQDRIHFGPIRALIPKYDRESYLCRADRLVHDARPLALPEGNCERFRTRVEAGLQSRMLTLFPKTIFRYREKDGPREVAEWQARAGAGDPVGLYRAGYIALSLPGNKDLRQYAVDAFTVAAEKGNPVAMVRLGRLLQDGAFVAADPQLARDYFRRAAEQGHPPGMYFHALSLLGGNGSLPDEIGGAKTADRAASRDWLEKAANLREVHAMLMLGQLLERSDPPNPAAALRWYLIADQIDPALPQVFIHRLRRSVTPARQLAESAAAMEWLSTHPELPTTDETDPPIARGAGCELKRKAVGISGFIRLTPCVCRDAMKDWVDFSRDHDEEY